MKLTPIAEPTRVEQLEAENAELRAQIQAARIGLQYADTIIAGALRSLGMPDFPVVDAHSRIMRARFYLEGMGAESKMAQAVAGKN